MKVCAGCSHEYEETFKFCPECGHKFGGEAAEDFQRKLDQHLLDMKRAAGVEAALSRRVFSGAGLGDRNVGPIYGQGHNDREWG